ncbi:MAG: YdeI/OmpD-associated family protein [Acidimicrobiales bacterium]
MGETLKITATFEQRGPAGAFVLTDDQVLALGGGRKAFPVTLTVNGATFPLRLARMGGENLIGLRKDVREAAGLAYGDVTAIEVAADEGERTVEVPDDLAAALAAAPAAEAAFAAMAYSHRKEYVRWVTEARKAETRATRIGKAVAMIGEGRTR